MENKIKVRDGETFTVNGMEFIKFPKVNGKVPVVMKDIPFCSRFGESNDLRKSTVMKRMNEEILPKLEEAFGDALLTFETDLTTLDGLKCYGVMESKISLPTLDFYRQNADIFAKHKTSNWWWLATPDSADPNGNPLWILCVSPSGCVYYISYGYCGIGVLPFCILNSSIFDSFEESNG